MGFFFSSCWLLQVIHAIGSCAGFARYSLCSLVESLGLKNVLFCSLFPSCLRICNGGVSWCHIKAFWMVSILFYCKCKACLHVSMVCMRQLLVHAWTRWLAPCEQQVVTINASSIQGLREKAGCKYQSDESAEETIIRGIISANKFWCICPAILKKRCGKINCCDYLTSEQNCHSHYQLSSELVSHSRLKGKKKLKYQYEMPKITADKTEYLI